MFFIQIPILSITKNEIQVAILIDKHHMLLCTTNTEVNSYIQPFRYICCLYVHEPLTFKPHITMRFLHSFIWTQTSFFNTLQWFGSWSRTFFVKPSFPVRYEPRRKDSLMFNYKVNQWTIWVIKLKIILPTWE